MILAQFKSAMNCEIQIKEISKVFLHTWPALIKKLAKFLANPPLNAQYTSPGIQNEMIGLIADNMRQNLISQINEAKAWGISFDKTPDSSNREQISVVARFVDRNSEITEQFLGFYDAFEMTTSKTLDAKTI